MKITDVPPAEQRTWLVDLDDVIDNDPLYKEICP